MSRPKSHFYTSAEPPAFGVPLVAICGENVPNAQPWFGELDDYGMIRVGCRACDEIAEFPARGKRFYRAIIVSGQESTLATD